MWLTYNASLNMDTIVHCKSGMMVQYSHRVVSTAQLKGLESRQDLAKFDSRRTCPGDVCADRAGTDRRIQNALSRGKRPTGGELRGRDF